MPKNKRLATKRSALPIAGKKSLSELNYELPSEVLKVIKRQEPIVVVKPLTSTSESREMNEPRNETYETYPLVDRDKNPFDSPWKLVFPADWEKQCKNLDGALRKRLHLILVKLCSDGLSIKSFRYRFQTPTSPQGLSCFHAKLTSKHGGMRLIYHLAFERVDGFEGIYEKAIHIDCVTAHVDDTSDNLPAQLEQEFATREKIDKISSYEPMSPEFQSAMGIIGKFPKFYKKKGENISLPTPKAVEGKDIKFCIPDYPEDVASHIKLKEYFSKMKERKLACLNTSQREIVNDALNGTPTIVQGRSGTGKSLCILWYMWAIYKSHWENSRNRPRGLHQIFITANNVLSKDMEQQFESVKATIMPQLGKNPGSLPSNFNSPIEASRYPLFLTTRQFIIMLDGTLSKPFYTRDELGELKFPKHLSSPEQITGDISLEALMMSHGISPLNQSEDKEKDNMKEIDFTVFENEVYPKLTISAKDRKNYPAALVWKEIYSFIKGSLASLSSPLGYLDETEYLALGKKQGSFDEAEITTNVYYDWNDVLRHLFLEIQKEGYSGPKIDYLTYDEVQDANQLELSVYFLLSSPRNFFFAGDTCQTIEKGISFRFEDLRSVFVHMNENSNSDSSLVPDIKHLSMNYRSTQGINNLALSVISLMQLIFPENHDTLENEESIMGPIPMVIFSEEPEDLFELMNGSILGDIDFSAHQVVIVRDEESKKNLPDLLRKALCVTVLESKGMEYDDVILYDFFHDKNSWEVVAAINKAGTDKGRTKLDKMFLNKQKFISLSDELKYLYVAITRGIKNVWFIQPETLEEKPPAIQYFEDKNTIEIAKHISPIDEGGNTGIKQSIQAAQEEWKQKGIYLQNLNRWAAAEFCFSKAKDLKNRKLCQAMILQQEAIQNSNKTEAKRQHSQAAVLFKELKLYEQTTASLFLAKKYKEALWSSVDAKRNDFTAFLYELNREYNHSISFWLKFGNIGIVHGLRLLCRCIEDPDSLESKKILSLLHGLIEANQISFHQCALLCQIHDEQLWSMTMSNLELVATKQQSLFNVAITASTIANQQIQCRLYYFGCKLGLLVALEHSASLDHINHIHCCRAFLEHDSPSTLKKNAMKKRFKLIKAVTILLLDHEKTDASSYCLLLISFSKWLAQNDKDNNTYHDFINPGAKRKKFKQHTDFVETKNPLLMVTLMKALYSKDDIESSNHLLHALFYHGKEFYSKWLPSVLRLAQKQKEKKNRKFDEFLHAFLNTDPSKREEPADYAFCLRVIFETLSYISGHISSCLTVINEYDSKDREACQMVMGEIGAFHMEREKFRNESSCFVVYKTEIENFLKMESDSALYIDMVYEDLTALTLPSIGLRKSIVGLNYSIHGLTSVRGSTEIRQNLLRGLVSVECMTDVYTKMVCDLDILPMEKVRLLTMCCGYFLTQCAYPNRISYSFYDKYFSVYKRPLQFDTEVVYYDILEAVVGLFASVMENIKKDPAAWEECHISEIILLAATVASCSRRSEKKYIFSLNKLQMLFKEKKSQLICQSCEKSIKWPSFTSSMGKLSKMVNCGSYGIVKELNGEFEQV